MSEDYNIIAKIIMLDSHGYNIERERMDFDTICEARSWLKAGLSPMIDLVENGHIEGFWTTFEVSRKAKK